MSEGIPLRCAGYVRVNIISECKKIKIKTNHFDKEGIPLLATSKWVFDATRRGNTFNVTRRFPPSSIPQVTSRGFQGHPYP
jgi:hypothetical protein